MLIEVDPRLGGRATTWWIDGLDVIASRSPDPVEQGMYPMAPWAGRIRGNAVSHQGHVHPMPVNYPPWALHGTVLDVPMQVTAHEVTPTASQLVLEAPLGDAWPWPGTCTITWQLRPGVLTTVIELTAIDAAYPAVVGWHPWFRRSPGRGGPLQVHLPAEHRLVRGTDHLPTGEIVPARMDQGPFDDAFYVPGCFAHLTWPGWIRLEVANSHPWFVLFDELPDAACLEPQSGPPDGLNGPVAAIDIVAPRSPLQMRTTWQVVPAPVS